MTHKLIWKRCSDALRHSGHSTYQAIFTAAALFLLCQVSVWANVEFALQGTITAKHKFAIPSEQEAYFTLSVSNCFWRIDLELPDQRISSGTDGQDIFNLVERTIELPDTGSILLASITPNLAPTYTAPSPLIPILWCAFASGCHFDSAETNTIPIVPPFMSGGDRFSIEANFTLLDETDGTFPETIDFIDPGYRMVMSREHPRKAPFHTGFVKARYQVTDTLITNGFHWPVAFSLRVFRPKTNATTIGDVELESQYDCNVARVALISAPATFKPELPGNRHVTILDARFGQYPYEYRSASWLDRTAVTNRPEFTQFKAWDAILEAREARDAPRRRNNRYFSSALFLLVASGVGLIAYYAAKRQRS